MASTRSIIAPPPFAANASTVIPPTPIAGVAYRDPVSGPASSEDGWPYAERVNSADFNQIMYQLSSLIEILDSKGILGWSDQVDYTVPGVQFGSDGSLYKWIQASGPNNGGAKDPISNAAYWAPFASSVSIDVAGTAGNVRASTTTATAAVQFTADQVIVSTALNGSSFRISSLSQVINLGTTGANGMDTGAAPVNGFVAIYAISNGIGGSALLAVNASASAQVPTIYGGANMPAGYIASGLISILPTNGSGQFKIFSQRNRKISIQPVQVLTSSSILSFLPVGLTSAAPYNATSVSGQVTTSSTAPSSIGITIEAATVSLGTQNVSGTVGGGGGFNGNYTIQISVPRTFYASTTNSAGTPTFTATVIGYEI